jgi:Ca2+-binding RTX toxin-like protein
MSVYDSYAKATAAEGLIDPTLAMNASAVTDYSTQMAFLDIAKMMRPWFGQIDGEKFGAVSNIDLRDGGFLDDNGWPTAVPDGVDAIETIWVWNTSTEAASYRAGTYVLEYEGEGELALDRNATILSEEPGRIVFSVTGDKNLSLSILSTDPDGAGDYIRDISIVREDYVELHEAGAIFNPQWLEMLEDLRQLRFMDWSKTNDSNIVEWDDRVTLDNFNWGGAGAPVEVMVRLANELGTDAWFCMPANASDDYIRQFATYVRDNLDPGLTASVEFSNETWNWSFDQADDISAMAKADWGEATTAGETVHYNAKLATEMALIWDEVFAEVDDAPGLVKVMGAQTGAVGRTKSLLKAGTWFNEEPDDAVSPADVFDAVAVTTYFGSAVSVSEDLRNELIAVIDDPEINAFDWLAEKLMDPDYPSSVPRTLAALREQKEMVKSFGLDLVAYEGGQHVHHMFKVPKEAAALGDFLAEFVRSPQMADLYQALWDGWSEIGDGSFMQFGSVSQSSKWGSWAVWENLEDSNPRGDLLIELNEETASWWEGGGANAAYLQGVTRLGGDADDILVGTEAEDYLIGGAGDDVLIAGTGNDGINGGDGHDLLLLSGTPLDYDIVAEGDGYRITGPDGSDFVINVEEFLFEDDSTFTFDASAAPQEDLSVQFTSALSALMLSRNSTQLGRTDLVVFENDVVQATDTGRGVMVQAVNPWAAIGKELAEITDNVEEVYLIAARGEFVEIGGRSVTANYWTTMTNLDAKGGAALADTALEATTALAAVTWGVIEIVGTSYGDILFGRGADDVFSGGGGADVLIGRGGNDRLHGGEGNDTLVGGAGEDIFVFDKGDGMDRIIDFTAEDQLDLRGLGLGVGQSLEEFASLGDAGDLNLDFGDGDLLIFKGLGLEDVAWIDALV